MQENVFFGLSVNESCKEIVQRHAESYKKEAYNKEHPLEVYQKVIEVNFAVTICVEPISMELIDLNCVRDISYNYIHIEY